MMFSDLTYVEVTLALITFVLVFMTIRNIKKNNKAPPGPWGLPIVGNIFQLGDLPHITLTRMKEHYGDVFLIKLGMVPVLVVSGLETVKKVLLKQGEGFAARPKLYSMSLMADKDSMSFSPGFGESWKQHKKIAVHALRTFTKSEAKTSTCSCLLEEYVSDEAVKLVKTLAELTKKKGASNVSVEITYAVANVVCALCYGKRYEHTDKEFLGIIELNEEAQKASGWGAAADFIPLVRYLPLPGLKALIETTNRFFNFSETRIREHYTTYDENSFRDITDTLISLCDQKKTKDKRSVLTDRQILSTVTDLFGAGFDTVSSGLQWAFLYLLHYPEIQRKIQEEIDDKIGDERLPRFDDRKELHYTEAFINEVFRHSSFVPFALPHCINH